ncbi:hypothetical protein E0E50_03050 [Azotobacter chroococcum subsp. isscasi]|uniref:HEPN domain-containing protein n=1 Tax=Azotobacter chroococcum TaxID=353 RepID=UPI00103B653C|nr:HEPN domain-containing protein [Azotobacter chroococcum]TBW12639.1 hypothetical protein E0E50_03050 [Azotobacter chroococcum subsp. isscasi]
MHSILTELNSELDDLERFCESVDSVVSLLREHSDLSLRQLSTVRRQYDYAAFVVALYAAFERFIEALAVEYARTIAGFTPYKSLPPALIRKHLTKSAEILRKRLGEGRYAAVTELDVARNLFKCLSGDTGYELTGEAISAHDNNLRYAELVSLFSEIGVGDLGKLLPSSGAMRSWYDSEGQDAEVSDENLKVIIGTRLDNLVERRNDVAHRGGSADDVFGRQQMLSFLGFIRALSGSLFNSLAAEYLKLKAKAAVGSERLEIVEGPYSKGMVIVVSPPKMHLYVGQPIYSIVASEVRWGRIAELQVDGASISSFEDSGSDKTIGIKLDFVSGKEVHVLHGDDGVVWIA